jgi:hypothetical protein
MTNKPYSYLSFHDLFSSNLAQSNKDSNIIYDNDDGYYILKLFQACKNRFWNIGDPAKWSRPFMRRKKIKYIQIQRI